MQSYLSKEEDRKEKERRAKLIKDSKKETAISSSGLPKKPDVISEQSDVDDPWNEKVITMIKN